MGEFGVLLVKYLFYEVMFSLFVCSKWWEHRLSDTKLLISSTKLRMYLYYALTVYN